MLNLMRIQVLSGLTGCAFVLAAAYWAAAVSGAENSSADPLTSGEPAKDSAVASPEVSSPGRLPAENSRVGGYKEIYAAAMKAMRSGNAARAEELLKSSLKMEAKQGAGEKELLQSNIALADLYRARGSFVEAESLYKTALARIESEGDSSSSVLPFLISKLAGLYKSSGQMDLSLSYYRKALGLVEKSHGAGSSEAATAHANLGLLYQKMGKRKEAESEGLTAIKIFQAKLGKDSPETAQCMSDLASYYLQLHNTRKAIPLFEAALAVFKKQPGSLSYATCADQLGTAYSAEGKYAEAEDLARKALEIYKEVLGPQNKETAISFSNLGYRLAKQSKNQEAIDCFKKSMQIQEKLEGGASPELLANIHGLAEVYVSQADFAKVEPLLRRDLSIREKRWGAKSVSLVPALRNLANCLILQGRVGNESDSLMARAESILAEVPPEQRKTVEPMIAQDLIGGLDLKSGPKVSGKAAKDEPW